jgi:hypothetical protein
MAVVFLTGGSGRINLTPAVQNARFGLPGFEMLLVTQDSVPACFQFRFEDEWETWFHDNGLSAAVFPFRCHGKPFRFSL